MDQRAAAAVLDVFGYVVVLNLFVEFLPTVLTETFTLSLLTALLLKAVLEVVVAVKNRVKARYREASTRTGRVVAAVGLWLLLVASKFVVLEAVDLAFGDRVSLGGFVQVTLLILTLMVTRAAVRRLLSGTRHTLGSGDPPAGFTTTATARPTIRTKNPAGRPFIAGRSRPTRLAATTTPGASGRGPDAAQEHEQQAIDE